LSLEFDVTNIILHGNPEEEIYVEVPLGFKDEEGKVCKPRKAFYRLK